jgi:glycosyltransferase involved in cell wall biosynthesis
MVKANHKYINRVMSYILYEKPEIIKYLFRLYGYDVIVTWVYQLPSFCLRSFENEIKIAWSHDTLYNFLPGAIDARPERDKQLQLRAWKAADRIVNISNISLQSLKEIFPELIDKTEIIYNGCDFSRIQQLSMENPNIKIPIQSQNIIIGAGSLDRRKNFELLIRAVSSVIHSGINCFLIIIGQGEFLSELQDIAAQENVKDSILFAGYQQNPYPYFKLSKIVCLSSFSEGLPTVIIEGMSLGKPFVTTPVAGASDELADNGRCGLVSDWKIEEYAGCIRKLLTDQYLYEDMSNNCIEKTREFTIENYVIQFDLLIKRLHDYHTSERIINDKKDKYIYKHIHAICYFALVFALIELKKPRITDSFRRYKHRKTFIDGIKLLYHISLIIISPFLFPFKFLIGLVRACFCGY